MTNIAVQGEAIRGGCEVLERLAPEWRNMCDRSPASNEPFCRPEWSIAYAHAYTRRPDIVAATVRSGSHLEAVLPLVRERTLMWGVPVRVLRRAVAADTPRFDLAAAEGLCGSDVVGRHLWQSLREDVSWDAIELATVAESAALRSVVTAAESDGFPTGFRRSFRTPIIPLDNLSKTAEDPWLARTSQHFRAELRRRTRRLEERGRLRVERFDSTGPEVLECYYDLERLTWKGEQGCAIASSRRRLQYYNELAAAAARFGYLSLYFLSLDGKAIAANFGLTSARKYYLLRCAFDPAFRQFSAGHILINRVLRDCLSRGLKEFDFLGEAHDYKREWTPHTVEHGFWYIFRRGAFGRALHALKFQAVPFGRKIFHRPLPA